MLFTRREKLARLKSLSKSRCLEFEQLGSPCDCTSRSLWSIVVPVHSFFWHIQTSCIQYIDIRWYMYSIESIYDVLTYPVSTRGYCDLPQPHRVFLISAWLIVWGRWRHRWRSPLMWWRIVLSCHFWPCKTQSHSPKRLRLRRFLQRDLQWQNGKNEVEGSWPLGYI